MTIKEIRDYSGIDVVLQIDEEAIAFALRDNTDCVVSVQKDPDDDEYVSLLALVRDQKTIILFVDLNRVTKEKIDLYFEENADILGDKS